jgi:hypothetical protein
MDALAHLALMMKTKLVFEGPGTFMSFPALSPVSYTTDQLAFGAFDSPAVPERLIYSEFARLVNALPAGTIFDMGDRFLWDIYGNILQTAILAEGQTTAEEDAAYQQATAFLAGKDASGLPVASPQLLAYQQLRDIWFQAVQNYKSQQSTAAAATDAAVHAQWKSVDEPRLRALVEQAHTDWEAKGFKGAIEQAQQVRQAYAARSPQLIWQTWSSSFNPDLDLQTDPNQQPFAPTSFAPADVFGQEWPTFRITRAEISQLVAQAPKELKDIFVPEGSQSTVDQLSFEYRSVSLVRPWFRREVFDARCWRLPAGSPALSDGAEPPQGAWPSYIAAMVFVRNIQVTMHADQAVTPPPMRMLPALQFVLNPHPDGKTAMRLAPVAAISRPAPDVKAAIFTPVQSNIVMQGAILRPAPATVVVRPGPKLGRMRVVDHRVPVPQAGLPPPSPAPHTSVPATPPSPPVLAADPRKDISVLAFICKRLPKAPNPDENLSWGVKPSNGG